MFDRILRKILFGNHSKLQNPTNRSQEFHFPHANEEDEDIRIQYRSDDGLILYLLKRIIKLEKRITAFEEKKK